MDFDLPVELRQLLARLDDFIATVIKPLEQQDDNIRFFDHRREDSRTDWERGGLPNAQWESLLHDVRQLADEAGFYRYLSKPVKVDELIDAIDAALRSGASR